MYVEIQSVEIEKVPSPKGGYFKAKVTYDAGAGPRSAYLVSYSNPGVWAKIKDAQPGSKFEVTITKNAKGYDEWSAIAPADGEARPPAAAAQTGTTGKVLGSQYETREERIARQRLIVRQSSLGHAVELLTTGAKSPPELDAVFALAEQFADFVYQPQEELSAVSDQ
jgi:hypothetical protein